MQNAAVKEDDPSAEGQSASTGAEPAE
jgi:hypothetical protein